MIDIQTAIMPPDGLLGLHGGHQPSLPGTSAALGFTDELTDYVFWSARREKGPLQDLLNSLLALQAATT